VPYFAGLSLAVLILARYEPTPLHALMAALPGFERIHARSPERALLVFYIGPALLAGASLTWLQLRLSSASSLRRLVGVVAIAALAVELQIAWRAQRAESLAGGGDYQFQQVDLAAYFAPTSATRFLQAHAQSDLFRYFGYAQHFSGVPIPYTLRWADPSITALEVNNRATIDGLDDIQGYNPIHVERYDEYVAALNGHAQNYHQTDVFDSGLASPLVDLLNVRYILVPAVLPSDQLAPRFRRPLTTVYQDENVRVLDNPTALPRAWLVHSAEQAPPRQALQALTGGAVDPRQVALLEEPPPPLGAPNGSPGDDVAITGYQPGRVAARTVSTTAGLLVLSDVYYPAWHAYVDGQAAHLFAVDDALQGVAVPAGVHRVEVRYESAALSAGLVVSLAAAATLVGLALYTRFRQTH